MFKRLVTFLGLTHNLGRCSKIRYVLNLTVNTNQSTPRFLLQNLKFVFLELQEIIVGSGGKIACKSMHITFVKKKYLILQTKCTVICNHKEIFQIFVIRTQLIRIGLRLSPHGQYKLDILIRLVSNNDWLHVSACNIT